jgi:co-chaperonin GroES (HSP10)
MQPTITDYIIHGTTDYIIIQAESRYENLLQVKGAHGNTLNLELDGEYEDDKKRIWGTVVAVPKRITPDRVMFSDNGKPVRMDQICLDVNPGEKLYFSYLALQDSTEVLPGHYAIPYSDAICVIREGVITPVGSHVLLRPAYPEDCVAIEPGVYGRVNSFGMVTELNVPALLFQGIVAHVGQPLKGEELLISPGMHVGIDRFNYGQKCKVEGEEYLLCRQKDIAWIKG